MQLIQPMTVSRCLLVPVALLVLAPERTLASPSAACASELSASTLKNGLENAAEDAKTMTKKGVRRLKRLGRKVIGTDTPLKDAKDTADDLKDDLQNKVNKTENRLDH